MTEPTIPGYTIIGRLGSGGFATVYHATEDSTATNWAVKVLHQHASNTDDLRRFERERTSMQALSGHPHIVSVKDHGTTDDGLHYTVLEFMNDGSVRDLLSHGALHWTVVTAIGVQICDALDIAHRNGVLHRDVKPANILLDGQTAKLTDFGIARLVGQSAVTAAQSIIGTLAYTPPELFGNSPFDGRGDIYQLGVTLYEMLLGRAPFTSSAADNNATIIKRILENPAPPLAQFDVPQPLSDLLDEVLAKDPADRPQSAATLRKRLNDVQRELGVAPTVTTSNEFTLSNSVSVFETAESDFVPIVEIAAGDETVVSPPPTAASATSASDPTTIATAEPAMVPPFASPEAAQAPHASPPAPHVAVERASTQTETEHKKTGVWKWALAAGLFALAVSAGVFVVAQLGQGGADPAEIETVDDVLEPDAEDDASDDSVDNGDTTPGPFAAFATESFTAPGGSDGIVFGSVANTRGLTVVGAAGDGTNVSNQSSQMWTVGPNQGELIVTHRRAFARDESDASSQQRLWAIGVIDQETFLAVGDELGPGGTDGVAWFGVQSGEFVRSSNASFTGTDIDSLRGATNDGNDRFIVVGARTSTDGSVPAVWTVTEQDDVGWDDPVWSSDDVNTANGGALLDIVVRDDLAAAVGFEDIDGVESGVVKVRNGGSWRNLIAPIPDARLWAVAIADDRVIAVGEIGETPGQREPFAVVANVDGDAFIHRLPLRGDAGIARDILATTSDAVVVVGDDIAAEERDAAIWEFLPGEQLNEDRWTTRLSGQLSEPGFIELWSIAEFDSQLFVFGRTETDDAQPAGAWILNLSS